MAETAEECAAVSGNWRLRPGELDAEELARFGKILDHEKSITATISSLFELSRAEKDYASEITLQWYVTEQVEEEANVGQIVDQLKAVGEQGDGIWYLDSKMGKRVATA